MKRNFDQYLVLRVNILLQFTLIRKLKFSPNSKFMFIFIAFPYLYNAMENYFLNSKMNKQTPLCFTERHTYLYILKMLPALVNVSKYLRK
jgi:hypothetical protein